MDRMTELSALIMHVEGATVLAAYEVAPLDEAPHLRRFHVAVRPNTYGPNLLLFAGAVDDLHDFLLGLHNVLSDAAESRDGRAERVVLRPTEAVDALDIPEGYGLAEGPSVD